MFGRMLVVACVVGIADFAHAQSTLRPEALLPPDTLMYVGTDDFEAARAAGALGPMGRVMAEQEVKEFLEKPLAELRKAIDMGVAMAKQQPALAGVEMDIDKMMAGPYGRSFLAITHLHLPVEAAKNPALIDIGLVVGIEPRGGTDLVGMVKQLLTSVARTEGAETTTIDTVTVNGVAIDRIKAKDAPISLCFANLGGVSVMSLSERVIGEMAGRVAGGQPSLLASPDFARGVAGAGAAGKGDLSVYMHVGRMLGMVRNVIDMAVAAEGEVAGEPARIARAVFDALNTDAFGPMYAVSTWKDGVAVNTAYSEVDPDAKGLAALARAQPIDRGLMQLVPKDALSFSLGHFDLTGFWDMAMGALKNASPEMHQQALAGIRNAEMMVAGADEQGNPNWDVRRDLIGALAGRMMSMSIPGAGSMLGPGGDTILWIESPNPAALEKSLMHLWALPGKLADFPINWKEQMHGNAKLMVLDPMSLGPAAMMAGQLSLTWTIHDGKFWFSTSTKSLKKALDSRATPPTENITAKADFAKRFVEPPQGAILTSLSYGDTAANFENSYTQILGVLPMVMMGMQQGGMEELPMDLSLLPTAEAISKHLFGTVSMSYQVGNGHVVVSRGPFGAETTVGAMVAGMGIAAGAGLMAQRQQVSRMGAPPAPVEEARPMEPADQTRADLADFSQAITVYMIEYGKPPASLAELTQPKPEYPQGFLEGAVLKNDPWGRAYAYSTDGAEKYTIWSFGANGVDDKGAGDDIVVRS